MFASWNKGTGRSGLDRIGRLCVAKVRRRSANLLAALQDKHDLDSGASRQKRTQTLLLKSGFQLA